MRDDVTHIGDDALLLAYQRTADRAGLAFDVRRAFHELDPDTAKHHYRPAYIPTATETDLEAAALVRTELLTPEPWSYESTHRVTPYDRAVRHIVATMHRPFYVREVAKVLGVSSQKVCVIITRMMYAGQVRKARYTHDGWLWEATEGES